MATYSVHGYFAAGSSVLLTGASGYVGGLVLEKLLRCTDVDTVYVLLRPKKGEGMEQRLAKMLASPVMHLLRGNAALSKVRPVAGSLLQPGLGISLEDRQTLQRNVQTVIHCAADIRLEVGIQDLLRANYEGTRQLLNLARSFSNLTAFVHVSSAYTNMNAQPGSLVKEAIYPLAYGDQLVDDHELVQELLDMPSHNANLRAEGLMAQWNFPNNYTLSKHLSEYMVADYHRYTGMPIAIMRPTLISSVHRDPYPGYTGNFAGHVGATLAFMAGLFNSPHASNYKGSNVWDVVPADVCANVILATAAAVGQGLAAACAATPTRHGRVTAATHGGAGVSAGSERLAAAAFHHRAAAAAKHAGVAGPAAASKRSYALHAAGDADADCAAGRGGDQAAAGAADGAPGGGKQELLIVHCGSSTTYPLTIMESWNYGVEVWGAWPNLPKLVWGCAGAMPPDHEPDPARAAYYVAWTGMKIWAISTLLRWFGEEKVARKLSVGFESFKVINQPKTDVNLRFSTANMQRLAARLDPAEADEFLLLWKPAAHARTSSAGGAAAVPGAAPRYGLAAPAPAGDAGAKAGAPHLAELVGAAEGAIKAAELGSPGPASSLGGSRPASDLSPSGSSSDVELPSSSDGEDSGSFVARRPRGGAAGHHGAQLSPEAQAALEAMHTIPIHWRDFHINLGAFLYCTVFRMPEPKQLLPIYRPEVPRWLGIKPDQQYVAHHFKLFK